MKTRARILVWVAAFVAGAILAPGKVRAVERGRPLGNEERRELLAAYEWSGPDLKSLAEWVGVPKSTMAYCGLVEKGPRGATVAPGGGHSLRAPGRGWGRRCAGVRESSRRTWPSGGSRAVL